MKISHNVRHKYSAKFPDICLKIKVGDELLSHGRDSSSLVCRGRMGLGSDTSWCTFLHIQYDSDFSTYSHP